MTRTIPERVRWAVATLDVDPADRILELGSGPLEHLSVGDDRFDKIFAIDVNHFWVRPAHQELDALRCLLKPGGRLYLFYGGTTGATKTRPLAERLAAALSERAFDATSVLRTDEPTPVLCVLGRNPDAAPIV